MSDNNKNATRDADADEEKFPGISFSGVSVSTGTHNDSNDATAGTHVGSVAVDNSLATNTTDAADADASNNYANLAVESDLDGTSPAQGEVILLTEGMPLVPFYKQKRVWILAGAVLIGIVVTSALATTLRNDSEGEDDTPSLITAPSPSVTLAPWNSNLSLKPALSNIPTVVQSSQPSSLFAPTEAQEIERFALTQIYNASNLNESCWTNIGGWLSEELHHCDWLGVYCIFNHTAYIDLPSNGLCGTIASEIGLLHDLIYLSVTDNDMTGSLPSEMFSTNMTKLRTLYLLRNSFTGSIPDEFINVNRTLEEFDIRSTLMTGTIPSAIGGIHRMRNLNFDYTDIKGSLPTEMGLLTSMQYFGAYSTQLTGTIPSEMGNLLSMKYFYIHRNYFTGTIPSELGLLKNMTYFDVERNQLEGPLPTELGMLHSLETFLIDFNSGIGGSFPDFLLDIPALEYLSIAFTGAAGTIPTELGTTQLEVLLLSNNYFTGTLPSEIGLIDTLTYLDFTGNQITGTVPTEFGDLGKLLGLIMFDNPLLSGSLPSEVCELTIINSAFIFADCVMCDLSMSCCTACF